MIKKFEQFVNEVITSDQMKNQLDLGIEKQDAQKPDPNAQQQQKPDQGTQKNATLKVTDIQNKINQLAQQKTLVNQEIINLQNAQRDLRPNNVNDPNNKANQSIFDKDQQEKTKIQQDKLANIDAEIRNLQAEIGRNKQKYL